MPIPTNLFEIQSTKAVPDPVPSEPAPESPSAYGKELLSAIRSDEAVECFGGRLFRRQDRYGNPIVSFAVENMNQLEAERANGSYATFSSMDACVFLFSCGDPENVVVSPQKKYTVFNFRVGKNEYSLYERFAAGQTPKVCAETIMFHLVELLEQYRRKLEKNQESYRPLNCLSLATVFVNEEGKLRILPLQAFKDRYPIEIPREVDGADIKSDLYSAAFVAVQTESGGAYGKVPMREPKAAVIQNCLKVARDWRPSMQVVINELKCGGVAQAPIRDTDGNSVSAHPEQKFKFRPIQCPEVLRKILFVEEAETQEQTGGTWGSDAQAATAQDEGPMFAGKV